MTKPWLSHPVQADGRLTLICFPFAGGGSAAFAHWRALVPDWLQVCSVSLPGRGDRYAEPRFTQFEQLVEHCTQALLAEIPNQHFAFYGHSLGAWIAHAVALRLQQSGRPPLALCVGAQRAPDLAYPFPPASQMSDQDLVEFMLANEALDPRMLAHTEWLRYALPVLRDDLTLCETHQPWQPVNYQARLTCPIHVFGGRTDRLIRLDELHNWPQHSRQPGSLHLFESGHFFLRSEIESFLPTLQTCLQVFAQPAPHMNPSIALATV